MNPTSAIKFSSVEKQRYPKFTLGPVTLNVPTGAIYGLIGPNGAGKTTLMNLIFGMSAVNAGAIEVCGYDHQLDEVAVKQRTAYVGPELNFDTWGSVENAIRFVSGFYPSWDDGYCSQLMEKLKLSKNKLIQKLSFGSRIKLSLILALSWRPQVLVLDEPTTGLDAHGKQALFSELLSVVKDESRAVFISSHQISDLERFADHIGILHKGRMIAEGMIVDLLERFIRVGFVGVSGDAISRLPGMFVQQREGNQWRVVLDTKHCALASLTEHGARDVQSGPITLEELFIVLTK